MILPQLKFRFFKSPKKSQRSHFSGFTLLELLIAMIIASIVVSGLLYLVVELVKVDRRESVLDRTQRDMQRALNYIADDIQEAVYLYDDPSIFIESTASTNPKKLTDLPTDGVPILAFWRPEPIETGLPTCSALGASTTVIFNQCEVLKIRRSAYSLVVYLQTARNSNANWPGQSRIVRYELDKYSNLSTLAVTAGYRDPAADGANFSGWTRNGASTAGTSAVLVDFVDAPSTTFNKSPLNDAMRPCSSLGANYTIVPSTATTTENTSFFGCIRSANPTVAGADGNGNQDAYLFLRGNTDGTGGSMSGVGRGSSLPILETRVLMRGIVEKNPD
jgi:prepilin-type N-terminal cleavage/methylation domain-containing protein